MTVDYQKVWRTMNDLEQVISKVCSAREMIDIANDAIVDRDYSRAETMTMAAYEFLGYFIDEFDDKFKDAWQATVGDLRSGDKEDQKSWNSFWESYYPEESNQYTEEELNAMCDKASSDQEKEKCREYNLREAEYYDKRVKLDAEHSQHYYDYTRNDPDRPNPFKTEKTLNYDEAIAAGWRMTDDGIWMPPQETPKKKWVLPVEQVHDDYFVSFPDDLLKAAKLKEGDEVNWIDNGDGSFSIHKVHKV